MQLDRTTDRKPYYNNFFSAELVLEVYLNSSVCLGSVVSKYAYEHSHCSNNRIGPISPAPRSSMVEDSGTGAVPFVGVSPV
jgi:hypothetical protein